MNPVVIDASVAAAWCFPDERSDYTNAVLRALSSVKALAPRLWAYELGNALLMGLRRGRLSRTDAREFLSSLRALDIQLTDPVSYDEVFELGEDYGLTYYDASYLDLVIRQRASLASLDDALRSAVLRAGFLLFEPQTAAITEPSSPDDLPSESE